MEVENLKAQVNKGKIKKEIWQNSFEELLKHDEELAAKDKEIASLRKCIVPLSCRLVTPSQYIVKPPLCQSVIRNRGNVNELRLFIISQENHQKFSWKIGCHY